mmetsp:Transcript_30547/g.89280  ORF Transcript_30547/g.89280 Transcript_30547/m.89280 type:complete len:298 (+) Transcript_30547:370-1263(+)
MRQAHPLLPFDFASLNILQNGLVIQQQIGDGVLLPENGVGKVPVRCKVEFQSKAHSIFIIDALDVRQGFEAINISLGNKLGHSFHVTHGTHKELRNSFDIKRFLSIFLLVNIATLLGLGIDLTIILASNGLPPFIKQRLVEIGKPFLQCRTFLLILLHDGLPLAVEVAKLLHSTDDAGRENVHHILLLVVVDHVCAHGKPRRGVIVGVRCSRCSGTQIEVERMGIGPRSCWSWNSSRSGSNSFDHVPLLDTSDQIHVALCGESLQCLYALPRQVLLGIIIGGRVRLGIVVGFGRCLR